MSPGRPVRYPPHRRWPAHGARGDRLADPGRALERWDAEMVSQSRQDIAIREVIMSVGPLPGSHLWAEVCPGLDSNRRRCAFGQGSISASSRLRSGLASPALGHCANQMYCAHRQHGAEPAQFSPSTSATRKLLAGECREVLFDNRPGREYAHDLPLHESAHRRLANLLAHRYPLT